MMPTIFDEMKRIYGLENKLLSSVDRLSVSAWKMSLVLTPIIAGQETRWKSGPAPPRQRLQEMMILNLFWRGLSRRATVQAALRAGLYIPSSPHQDKTSAKKVDFALVAQPEPNASLYAALHGSLKPVLSARTRSNRLTIGPSWQCCRGKISQCDTESFCLAGQTTHTTRSGRSGRECHH